MSPPPELSAALPLTTAVGARTDSHRTLYKRLLALVEGKLRSLPDKPDETAEATLRALWLAAADQPTSARLARDVRLPQLDARETAFLQELIDQRLQGQPLAHLTGREHFMGIELLTGPEALVPRRETELLGYAALKLLQQLAGQQGSTEEETRSRRKKGIVVIDLCTGCGNLALALAYHQPAARVFGSDISPEAIGLAGRNAVFLGLHQRVEWRQSDLFDAFEDESFYGSVDLVTCNPPYISSGKVEHMPEETSHHEPKLAFDGGPLGVNLLHRLMRQIPRFLRPGGWLALEVGKGQGPGIVRRLRDAEAFSEVRAINDHHGEIRAVLARRSYVSIGS